MKSSDIVKKAALVFLIIIAFSMIKSPLMAQTPKTDSLALYRSQIDSLDKELIEILGKRMQVVQQIGHYKAANHLPALAQNRFDAILKKNIDIGAALGLSAELITDVMNAIHKEALGKENDIAKHDAERKN